MLFYSFGAEKVDLVGFVQTFDCHHLNNLNTKNLDLPHTLAPYILKKLYTENLGKFTYLEIIERNRL